MMFAYVAFVYAYILDCVLVKGFLFACWHMCVFGLVCVCVHTIASLCNLANLCVCMCLRRFAYLYVLVYLLLLCYE